MDTTTEAGKQLETTAETNAENVESTIKNELDNGTSSDKLGNQWILPPEEPVEITTSTTEAVTASTNPAISEKAITSISVYEVAQTEESTLVPVTEPKANSTTAIESPTTVSIKLLQCFYVGQLNDEQFVIFLQTY